MARKPSEPYKQFIASSSNNFHTASPSTHTYYTILLQQIHDIGEAQPGAKLGEGYDRDQQNVCGQRQ